ncbi:MAG: histidine kinase [Clostridiales bacterium]|nr:histidine kinase [Clostridiales bacterium]
MMRYVTMTLDYFAAFILALILVNCAMEKRKTPLLKIYIRMASFCTAALLLEGVSYSVSLAGNPETDTLQRIMCIIAVICGYGIAFDYTCYVENLVGLEHRICSMAARILIVTGIAAAGAIVAGSRIGWFFTVENGTFIPGRFFTGIFAYDIIACAVGIFLVVKYSKRLLGKDITALLLLPLLIFASGVLQYAGFGMLPGLFMLCGVSLFIIYLMIQSDCNRQNAEQEKMLVDMNVSLMLSQIQPHFLYNSLSSIRRLIRIDPEVAETAVENFSLYLRQNLESMNRVEPVSFAGEMNHVREYLYLEKLRFGDRLRVEYDLACEDFVLPSLSLQPVVENAVKHGILQKEQGGCVRIRTRRDGKNVILTVEDDGVGFDPDTAMNDGRMHIGLENVKKGLRFSAKERYVQRAKSAWAQPLP